MSYEKMTGAINLEELEVQAEEVTEVSGSAHSWAEYVMWKEASIWLLCSL